jgi:TolB-like protein/Flp pilus assembly protein TadD
MLVVLPFKNLSGDPGQEYFSDGITEELNKHLGNLSPHRLGVIGRTSAMTYKQSNKTINQIGKELSVDYVLEGSVRRDGGKLRVTAQLVLASDQTHLWAEDYDRDVRDLLQLENEVAGKIARQVGVSIALDRPPGLQKPHTLSLEAHEAFILGRYNLNTRTPSGWKLAVEYFRRAIEKDPQYAAAYAGLAACRIPYREARAAASKAVELDPASGEAYAALGWIELYQVLDLQAAESDFKRALQLEPNLASAHHYYSQLLAMTGRWQESIAEGRQSARLDPLSLINRAALADVLSLAGQNDVAVDELRMIFAVDAHYPKAHEMLGNIYTRIGKFKEASHEYQLSGENAGDKLLGLQGYADALAGNRAAALRAVSQLQGFERQWGNYAFELALVELGLGNKEKALSWLEKNYQKGDDDGLLWLKVDPMFAPIRSDPRFQNLLRRVNFQPS